MGQVLKAKVLKGAYADQVVKITNISVDGEGKKRAACMLPNGARANLLLSDLEIIPEEKTPEPPKRASASMPFMSGSTGSRSLNQTKSLVKDRVKTQTSPTQYEPAVCERCGEEYNLLERRGRDGKVTLCPDCAELKV